MDIHVFVKLSEIQPNSLLFCLPFYTSSQFDSIYTLYMLVDFSILPDDDHLQLKYEVYIRKNKVLKQICVMVYYITLDF